MKKHLIILLCLIFSATLFAQQHTSVPLTDPVYQILESAIIKGYIAPMPEVRPYSQKTIVDALYRIGDAPQITKAERVIVQNMLKRFTNRDSLPWYQRGSYVNNSDITKENNDTGLPLDSEEKTLYTRVEVGATWESGLNFGLHNTDGIYSTDNWLDVYIQGDLSDVFSYRFQAGVGVMDLDLDAYPYMTYSKNWDGYQFPFSDGTALTGFTESPATALRILPELSVSLWDQKLRLNFSRVRRDWGPGDGNLMISKTARPFIGLDMQLNPIDWMNLAFMVGTLEFDATDGGIKGGAEFFQNAYSSTMLELFMGKWAYLSLSSSTVWPKRFELGYGHPGMLPILYQNMIGDFDNLQFGAHFRISYPEYFKIYSGIYIDEMKFSKNFFHLDRNMYTWQVGADFSIPKLPFAILGVQYTKVEPYMYTHPTTNTPWYDEPMDTTYINHGEALGYKLDPNSDELKIKFETTPLWFLRTSFSYRMVRHGLVDGSTYDDTLDYKGDLNGATPGDTYWKDFLKDGVYEWIHSLALNADLDLRFVEIPVTLGMSYIFSYRHLTDYVNSKLIGISSYTDEKGNKYLPYMSNLFSISAKVWL
ncbi:MAG: DUF4131 domain-containing protein [Spirochaetia bacterium]|nr:DUF4131 domain-containing protein [Spirochaetia bacterium]